MEIYKDTYSPMQLKSANKVLKAKFKSFLKSITDDEVRELVKGNTIITGGSIASMLMGQPINDFDLYFRNHKTALAVAHYYVDKFTGHTKFKNPNKAVGINVEADEGRIKIVVQSAGAVSSTGEKGYEYFEANGTGEEADKFVESLSTNLGKEKEKKEEEEKESKSYSPVFLSANAITLRDRVQLIVRFYGEPEEIHKNYDFIHCTNYWTSWEQKITTNEEALLSLMSKTLYYSGSEYPLCSIIRLRKFIARGWKITAGQILKMCYQISHLDLDDVSVLQDQLTGVDAAYFLELIEKLKADKLEGKTIDETYLVLLIDNIFES